MPLTHYSKPQIKIRCDPTGADDELQDSTIETTIEMNENAIDTLELTLADENNEFYKGIVNFGDDIAVYMNYQEEGALGISDLVFYGYIEDLSPFLSLGGEILNIKCRSYARCLLDLVCGEEYGSQSIHPTLDTVKEILTNDDYGLIIKWVNKLLGDGAVPSGYGLDASLIEDIKDVNKPLTYQYCAFKPAKNVLDDLLDYLSSIKGPSSAAGHWIVKTIESPADTFTHYLLLATLGNHPSSPNILAKWPTWWNPIGDTEELKRQNSTIVVKQDMVIQQFMDRRFEANYILYYGKFLRPANIDVWTEDETLWYHPATYTGSPDTSEKKVGSCSISFSTTKNDLGNDELLYPDVDNGARLNFDINKIGGRYAYPSIGLYVYQNGEFDYVSVKLNFAYNVFGYPTGELWKNLTLQNNTWGYFSIPIGPYALNLSEWNHSGTINWSDLDAIGLYVLPKANDNTKIVKIDGLRIGGWVQRGAKKASETFYKTKVVVDDIGKDDTLDADDDKGTMSRLAAAELFRCSRRPITGTIQIPAKPKALAGQLAHVHGVPYSGGYRVDKDMRIPQHRLILNSSGFFSQFSLTDDILNSRAMSPMDLYNLLERATAPEHKTRELGSIKARDIDVTIERLEKVYTFGSTYP